MERTSKNENRSGHLRVRVSGKERYAFETAARLLGLDLSTWTRAELRRAAIKELRHAGYDHEADILQ